MKWKSLALVVAVTGMAVPSVVSACTWGLNERFLGIPSKMNFGVDLLTPTDDLFGSMVISGSLGIGLGERFTVVPAVGLCTISDEDFSEVMFGAAAAFQLFASADNKFKVNAQAGISLLSYGDDGATETNIPIGASGQYQASEKASIYFGAGLIMGKYKDDFFDESDSDPEVFGGINLMIKKLMLNAGLGAKIGDVDTDVALNLGLRVPLGGS